MLLVSRAVTGRFIDQTDAANRELLAQTAINMDYTLTDLHTEYYQLWQKILLSKRYCKQQDRRFHPTWTNS